MSTKEKEKVVRALVSIITECQKEVRNLGDIINRDCELFAAYDRMEYNYITAVALLIGDESNWIEWYVYDNDCGRKGLEAGIKGDLSVIDSVEKLVKLIETSEQPISYIGKNY